MCRKARYGPVKVKALRGFEITNWLHTYRHITYNVKTRDPIGSKNVVSWKIGYNSS